MPRGFMLKNTLVDIWELSNVVSCPQFRDARPLHIEWFRQVSLLLFLEEDNWGS